MHLELFPEVPAAWRDDELAEKWRKVRTVRRVVTGALEIERAQQAHRLLARGRTRSCMCRTRTCSRRWSTSISPRSASPRRRRWSNGEGPADAFRLPDVAGRRGRAESRRRPQVRALVEDLTTVGTDPQYPDVTPRDAQALREWEAMRKAAE